MHKLKAAFIRGGTSKALVFHQRDLPADRTAWDALFLKAMGSPDRYGRQLNGMGGGVSSLSKVCVVGPPTVPGADVDYTFVQVQIQDARCDYSGNCGNMSSAIGPFAVAEGLLQVPQQGQVVVRIHNTNTRKIIHAAFEVRGGQPVEEGDLEIPGVHGGGAPVRLDFLEPGGATTGHLLPTGSPLDRLDVPGVGLVEVSMVDAANACVFVNAADLGLTGCELPEAMEADVQRMRVLAEIRWSASVAMGIAPTRDAARDIRIVPLIAFLSPPQDSGLVGGGSVLAQEADLTVRMLSSGQPHRALPLTGALCTAVAAQVEGSLAHRLARRGARGPLRLAMPSGVLTVDAQVGQREGRPFAQRGSFFRTTRRLFEGMVIV